MLKEDEMCTHPLVTKQNKVTHACTTMTSQLLKVHLSDFALSVSHVFAVDGLIQEEMNIILFTPISREGVSDKHQ